MARNTYGEDLSFLADRTAAVELTCGQKARAIVAPEYQGRVMTSTLEGLKGAGFGWINRPFVASGAPDAKFNNYGGEDRFWLGPEAGQFGLWFAGGEPFDTAHWKTPEGFNSGAFQVTGRDALSVAMTKQFEVANYSGSRFQCSVQRTVRMLSGEQGCRPLGAPPPDGVKMVGFESCNTLTNAGQNDWTREGGLVSIWTLGMFKPLAKGQVIVPFIYGDAHTLGPPATTDYFGAIPKDRCTVGQDHVFFRCDGRFRSKIGVSRRRAKDVIGSFDSENNVLTVVQFNRPTAPAQLPYVNSLWKIQDDPYDGDVVNSYNDGEEKPGAGQLGPFYELETSSPAAELKPGQSITHVHRTYHFAGDFDALNELAIRVLGLDMKTGMKVPSDKPKVPPKLVG